MDRKTAMVLTSAALTLSAAAFLVIYKINKRKKKKQIVFRFI